MTVPLKLGEQRSASTSAAGPSSYVPGSRPTVSLSDLVSVESENDVTASVADTSSGGGGFIAQATSVNGNTVSVAVYDVGSSSGAGLGSEVSSGDNISSATIKVRGRGY